MGNENFVEDHEKIEWINSILENLVTLHEQEVCIHQG